MQIRFRPFEEVAWVVPCFFIYIVGVFLLAIADRTDLIFIYLGFFSLIWFLTCFKFVKSEESE